MEPVSSVNWGGSGTARVVTYLTRIPRWLGGAEGIGKGKHGRVGRGDHCGLEACGVIDVDSGIEVEGYGVIAIDDVVDVVNRDASESASVAGDAW